MNATRAFLLSASLLAMPAPAISNALDASALLKACTTASMHWVDFCNGFFQAVHDYGEAVGDVCSPAGLQRSALAGLYERAAGPLIAHDPSVGTKRGFVVAHSIIRDRYPCRK